MNDYVPPSANEAGESRQLKNGKLLRNIFLGVASVIIGAVSYTVFSPNQNPHKEPSNNNHSRETRQSLSQKVDFTALSYDELISDIRCLNFEEPLYITCQAEVTFRDNFAFTEFLHNPQKCSYLEERRKPNGYYPSPANFNYWGYFDSNTCGDYSTESVRNLITLPDSLWGREYWISVDTKDTTTDGFDQINSDR